MTEASFTFSASARHSVIRSFLYLPDDLRPTAFSISEDSIGSKIEDAQAMIEMASALQSGFFLTNSNVSYSLSFAGTRPFPCYCDIDLDASAVKTFMSSMASAQPIFGFACTFAEWEARNRITTKLGKNTIESWVGRDPAKAVPGLYWLTLLPAELAAHHGVPLSTLDALAMAHDEVAPGQHLFQFCATPEDWRRIETPSLPGLFDIERVKPLLYGVKTYAEYSDRLRPWT